MFTGIVECCGEVTAVEAVSSGVRLSIELPFAEKLGVGESVAINGCCLTATTIEGDPAPWGFRSNTGAG